MTEIKTNNDDLRKWTHKGWRIEERGQEFALYQPAGNAGVRRMGRVSSLEQAEAAIDMAVLNQK